jgi:transcriptional regulator PpsR
MQTLVSRDVDIRFQNPEDVLSGLDAEGAGHLIAAASDVALVLDADGVIQDVAFGNSELAGQVDGGWLGRPWAEIVTLESRPKVEEMLREAGQARTRWRQVNHPVEDSETDIPVKYTAVSLGQGRVLAVGREMRALAALQQRLVDTQLSLEREYARLRTAETRYRLLFQIAAEAVLVVDATSQKIVEANPAAAELLDVPIKRLVGTNLYKSFTAESAQGLDQMLARVRETGRPGEVDLQTRAGDAPMKALASIFRQDGVSMYLIRVTTAAGAIDSDLGRELQSVGQIVGRASDAFVITDPTGRILWTNPAFLDMTQVPTEDQARGQPLDRWLGRSGVDLNVLMANLKEHGTIRLFATTLRSEYGTDLEVEMSATAALDTTTPCLGFLIRGVDGRLPVEPEGEPLLPKSAEQLTNLVGRVPLKDLVQETTDIIERLCIEAALRLTGDNRASAAEMLGLSRQSLYVKLRRHGIGNLD